MGIERRVVRRAAEPAVVSRSGNDQRARPDREVDRGLQHRVVGLAAEAEVDDARPAKRRRANSLNGGEVVEDAERARVPHAQHRVRIHADKANAVVRRADHRADRSPMILVGSSVVWRLRISVFGRLARLGVRDVEAGVDDRDRLARPG